VSVVAISVFPPETNRELCREQGYTFPFLSDQKTEAIRRYDLLDAGGGQEGDGIVRPAEFLVDATGTVRWANLTKSLIVRTRPSEILKVINDLNLGATKIH